MGTILELETTNSNSLRSERVKRIHSSLQSKLYINCLPLSWRDLQMFTVFSQGHSFCPQWMDCIKLASFSMFPLLPIFSCAPEGQIISWTIKKNFKFLQSLICGSFISLSQTLGPKLSSLPLSASLASCRPSPRPRKPLTPL